MRTIPRTVILSLIVFSTTWVSMATAAEPGITTLSGSVAEPAAGQTRMQDTVGYAVSDPFGPIFHVEGNFGDGLGYDTGYWGGGLMLPYFTVPGKGLFFGAIEGSGTDDSGIVMNLGGGYRQYAPGWDRIFGVSGWYDFDSGHEDDYSRMGVSFESLGKYLDLRANGYFLLDTDSKEISNGLVGDPFFRQNFIIGLRQIITEIPYHGADFEVGGPVPVLGRYGLYAHAG
ncbi:MAG: inverse autotransporter beta domain-containing protein, partial [Planctomycetaceae bacterium]